MRFLWKKLKNKVLERFVFVKTVHIWSYDVEKGVYSEWASVNLYECTETKKRKHSDVLWWPTSIRATKTKAEIEGWIYGGPLPLCMGEGGYDPRPKPRKPLPERSPKKPKKVLSSFEGSNVINFQAKVS